MSNPLIQQLNDVAAERSRPPIGSYRGWSGTAQVGTIYYLVASDLHRVGNCWAQGRLKTGDNLLCVGKSGDSFYDYLLLETKDYINRPGYQLKAIPMKLGAYQLGMPVCHLSDEEYTKLIQGDQIETEFKWGGEF